jgi:glycosyltransferase involved in cell wall biosynthesis
MVETLRVSAIVTCFNGAAFVADAIASIRRQRVAALEIVVIDDGSTDETAAVIASLGGDDLHYYAQHNQGLPQARNAGLNKSTGDIITFLDQDDVWADDKLEIQLALLEKHPGLQLVVGYQQKMRLASAADGCLQFEAFGEPGPALSMGGAAIRRGVFDKVGQFDPMQRYCDDWDWYMRAREMGIKILMHADVVLNYRRHDRNMTNDVDLGNQQTLLMLKKSLDRRRTRHGSAQSLPGLVGKNAKF